MSSWGRMGRLLQTGMPYILGGNTDSDLATSPAAFPNVPGTKDWKYLPLQGFHGKAHCLGSVSGNLTHFQILGEGRGNSQI